MKAAIYARFSTSLQDVQSIADQVRICTEWATREGATVERTFSDEGISGAAIGNRPAFLAMMRAAQAREFQLLLVMDLSRLSRSQGDLAKTIDRLTYSGMRIVGVQDGFDTARDGHELVSGLSGIIGQQFRKMVAKKTHSALQSRALMKRAAGGRSYGYRPDLRPDGTKGVAIVDSEAIIIREIFDAYGAGKGMKTIAGDLNQRAVPSPGASWNRTVRRADGKWLQSTIFGILRNETFIGRAAWNRTRWIKDPDTGKRRCEDRPRSEWIEHAAPELRIVSDAQWQLVQERITTREAKIDITTKAARSRRGGQAKYLLSGLLTCAVCGSKFTVSGIAHRSRYICGSHCNGGEHACSNRLHVVRELAEHHILEETVTQLLSPEAIALAGKEMQRVYRERKGTPQVLPKKHAAEVAKLDRQLEELERLKREGVLSKDVAAAAAEKARSDRAALLKASEQGQLRDIDRVVRMLPKAAEAYRQTVGQITVALSDPRRIHRARAALRELLGESIPLAPAPSGDHLIAEMTLNRISLFQAAGMELWNGSGGVLPHLIATLPRCPKGSERWSKPSKKSSFERQAFLKGATRRMAW
jgi:site-specific DNA recombinase